MYHRHRVLLPIRDENRNAVGSLYLNEDSGNVRHQGIGARFGSVMTSVHLHDFCPVDLSRFGNTETLDVRRPEKTLPVFFYPFRIFTFRIPQIQRAEPSLTHPAPPGAECVAHEIKRIQEGGFQEVDSINRIRIN